MYKTCTRVYPKVSGLSAGARTANGTALCNQVQLYRYFMNQSGEFFRHNPLCCFSTSVYCSCCRLFRQRLIPETYGYTFVWKRYVLISKWPNKMPNHFPGGILRNKVQYYIQPNTVPVSTLLRGTGNVNSLEAVLPTTYTADINDRSFSVLTDIPCTLHLINPRSHLQEWGFSCALVRICALFLLLKSACLLVCWILPRTVRCKLWRKQRYDPGGTFQRRGQRQRDRRTDKVPLVYCYKIKFQLPGLRYAFLFCVEKKGQSGV
jgi:hypothetical protein